MYRQMFKVFMSVRDSDDDNESSISDIVSAAKANMLECNKKMSESESCSPLKEYLERTRDVHSKVHEQFTTWVSACKGKDPNWKFWADFVFRDMLSYLSLFLSMRSGLWELGLSGIKSMAPLFVAFDRPHYQKLIPNHLRDLAKMPDDVMKFLEWCICV